MKNDFNIFRLIVVFFICFSIVNVPIVNSWGLLFAQDAGCEKVLKEAEQKYTDGRFDEAINLITRCLEDPGITAAQKQKSYRLMGLTYIAKDYLIEAKSSIQKLLLLVPNYKPDPVFDPPPFINIVEEVKRETVTVPVTREEEKTDNKKWYWIGGGVAAIVVLIAVLALGNGNGDDKTLPGAPSLP